MRKPQRVSHKAGVPERRGNWHTVGWLVIISTFLPCPWVYLSKVEEAGIVSGW